MRFSCLLLMNSTNLAVIKPAGSASKTVQLGLIRRRYYAHPNTVGKHSVQEPSPIIGSLRHPPQIPAHSRTGIPAKLKRCAGGGLGNLFVALKDGSFVDNATKRQLKQPDQFVALTEAGVHWTEEHRKKAIIYGIVAVVAIIAIVAGYSLYQSRSSAASTAFGQAMEVYQSPLSSTGEPPAPGVKTYPDAKTRAAAANIQFQQVANQYGLTNAGRLSEYFVGLTYVDQGQLGPAQQVLE
jgi:hypothetical protein